jgi:flagellar basal body L-ring protein FlgH
VFGAHRSPDNPGWVTDAVGQAVANDDNFFGVAKPSEVGDVIALLVSEAGAASSAASCEWADEARSAASLDHLHPGLSGCES